MKRLVLLLVLLAGGVALAAYAVNSPPQVARVAVTSADAASADQKARTLEVAAEQARQTGRPVPVTVTFTDAELTALANEQLASRRSSVDSIVLRSNPAGYVEGTASGHVAGRTLPIYFRAVLVTPGGHPRLSIVQTRVGAVGVPQAVVDELVGAVSTGLDLGPSLSVEGASVRYGEGQVTLTGTILSG